MQCKCGKTMDFSMNTVDSRDTEQVMYLCRGCGRHGYRTKKFLRDGLGFCTEVKTTLTYGEPRPDKVAKWNAK